VVASARNTRTPLRLCAYAFELLIEVCLEKRWLVLIRLLNQYTAIQGGRHRAPSSLAHCGQCLCLGVVLLLCVGACVCVCVCRCGQV
jgi:hypothetical protein